MNRMKRELKIQFLDALLPHLPKRNGFIIRNIVKGPAHIDTGKVIVNDALRFVLEVNDEDYSEMTAFMIDEGFAVRVTDGNPWPGTIQLTEGGRKLQDLGRYEKYVKRSRIKKLNWTKIGAWATIVSILTYALEKCSG